MEITRPDYYKEFSCIAGACPDTCCAGWQIVIDDKSLKKYNWMKDIRKNAGREKNSLLNEKIRV